MGLFKKKSSTPPKSDSKQSSAADLMRTTVAPTGLKRRLGYNVANLQGIGSRAQQEDSFGFVNVTDVSLIRRKGLLAIVCDGMGGMQGGKLASETAVASIREDFESFDYTEDYTEQLSRSLVKASEKIYSLLSGEGGSTAIVCLFFEERLYYVSAGDSSLFLKRYGNVSRINRKHTVFTDRCFAQLSHGIADPAGPKSDPEAHALTQYLGKYEIDDLDGFKKPLKLKSGDVILICSDGVGDVLTYKELEEALSGFNPSQMCQNIEEKIFEKANPHQDNYTALVIQCEK